LRLVDQVGVSGVTTKRIAREVGVVEGALYKHFNSKHEIFHRLLEVAEMQLRDKFAEMDERRLAPDQWLEGLFDYVVRYLEEFPGLYRIVFSDALYAEDNDLFWRFKTVTYELKDRAEQAIRSGAEAGLFRSGADPATWSILYLGMVHTSFTLWSIFEGRARRLSEVAQPLFAEYMNSLRRRREDET